MGRDDAKARFGKVLITGGAGRLGTEMVAAFPGALAPTHDQMDVSDRKAVFEYVAHARPDLILHSAAVTAVRTCEVDRELAWTTNVGGTQNLVDACLEQASRAHFVFISTACVFDGNRGMYLETDVPNPKNFYAFTKLVGEYVVSRIPESLIVRTNFVAAEKWPYPKAFIDRFGTYLFAAEVACGVRELVAEGVSGVVHVVGDRKLSMYELARLTADEIEPMTLAEYDGPPVTVDMSLGTSRWRRYQIGSGR